MTLISFAISIYPLFSQSTNDASLICKSDDSLVALYRDGNEDAFPILVKRYLAGIYSYAYRITHNGALAEDIAQETFVKAWQKIGSYQANGRFKSWLFSITHNTAIDFLRREKHFVFSDFDRNDETNHVVDTLTDETPSPHELAIIHERGNLLVRVLDQLAPLDQAILTLHYNEDLTFAEIGTILQKPLNTVKSRHRRAISMLGRSKIISEKA